MVEQTLILFTLLLIISVGLLFPILLKRFKLPLISLMIISGSLFGPNFYGIIIPGEVLEFFAYLGMVFLMILAGSDVNLKEINQNKKKVIILSLFNGGIPFLFGFLVSRYFGYSLSTSILLGIVFISSSVAIIIPLLDTLKLNSRKSKNLILSSVLLSDILSLMLLAIILHRASPVSNLPLYIYLPILGIILFLAFKYSSKLGEFLIKNSNDPQGSESKFRIILFVIFFLLLIFSVLGLHTILASFLIGLLISGLLNIKSMKYVKSKIHAIGYGLFIPVFFFLVGMEIDYSLFRSFEVSSKLMIIMIFGLIASKIISGFISGKIIGMPLKDRTIFGIISTVQLTTTLAVTYTASSSGLFDNVLTTSVIILSIITIIIGPILLNYFYGKNGGL